MKQAAPRNLSAFTIIEMLVVIASLVVLVAMLLPALRRPHFGGGPTCVINLKEIGTAYRLWEEDNGGLPPAEQSVLKGGWKELLSHANQGSICWTNYAIMSNELGQSPKLLVCLADDRRAAANFNNDFKDNTHVSYFVGVSAKVNDPQSIIGGDRNLGPGSKPDPDFGFSPKNGKGNDVAVPISGPVSWSLKMHSAGKPMGLGNILLGDGSVQHTSSADFRTNWLSHAAPTTNWPDGRVPAVPSLRLVFP